jgi:hypothetical protein
MLAIRRSVILPLLVALYAGMGVASPAAQYSPPLESGPQPSATACGLSQVPAGDVVTRIYSSTACSPYFAYTTTAPYDSVVMCTVTPVPMGWVVTGISTPSSCTAGGIGNPAYYGYRLYQPYESVVMCSVPNYVIPSGWVVTQIFSTSTCSTGTIGGPAYMGRRLRLPATGLVVCASSPIPAGWKRGTQVSTSNCNGEWGYKLSPL